MGLLQPERGRYRLPRQAVEKGLGLRHDRPRSGHPFDVISPLGQQLIAEVWAETVADYEDDLRADALIIEARRALDAFKARRWSEMSTQEEVCWLRDHFERMSLSDIARVLEVDRALVSRYAKKQADSRGYWTRFKERKLIKAGHQDATPVEAETGAARPNVLTARSRFPPGGAVLRGAVADQLPIQLDPRIGS